jgi:hypothetical protein
MPGRFFQRYYFVMGILALCVLYLAMTFAFNRYALLTVDEFWYAHVSYQYKTGLPYRDFSPYKTVLGYYFLLLPLLLSSLGIMPTLVFTKQLIALVNTLILLGSSVWLKRLFSAPAVLASLALLIFSETVLFYSTNIRVDLLAYWWCFFSVLFLLEKRYLLSGLLIGLGFVTSQKALWFILASNVALAAYAVVLERQATMAVKILCFNGMALLIIMAYLLFWGSFAGIAVVLHNVFYEAAAMYHLAWYDAARKSFWELILLHNPLPFLLWPLPLLSLLATPGTPGSDPSYERCLVVISYALTVLACLVPYKQVFPYYMQVTIPTFFLLYAAFFNWLRDIFKQPAMCLRGGKILLRFFCGIYSGLLFFMVMRFHLPRAYLLLCLIPLVLGVYLTAGQRFRDCYARFSYALICSALVVVGVVYSVVALIPTLMAFNGAYQRANIAVINRLVADSDYLAGIELLYNKTQPIAGLRHLMGPAIAYLFYPAENLRPVMLASLYEDPQATAASVVSALEKSTVKFYVNNYRIRALPPTIKKYLAAQYAHWWGSIYLYAPVVNSGQRSFVLKFSGLYTLASSLPNKIRLHGKNYAVGSRLHLAKGSYFSEAEHAYRLQLQPEETLVNVDKRFQKDEWEKLIF